MQYVFMWTVNDLPIYDMTSRWTTAGVMGYPVCMDDARAFHLQYGRKACNFYYHTQFLPEDHPYRRKKKAFTKNFVEYKVACPRLTRDQIRNWVVDINPAIEMPLTLPFNYGSDHKWTKKSIFCDLPYWAMYLI
ncbi:UNVERIFIED_CONTAM: hypothetical protein Scaly_3122000 [Sesamum calycinum]|uniref:Uncharacterized protein n=1 Tax=Sesamum calycinum TaxID=2727403 RepID=A0AAW2JLB0_9LAMI